MPRNHLQRELVPTVAFISGELNGVRRTFRVTGHFRGRLDLIYTALTQAPFKFHGVLFARRAEPGESIPLFRVNWS
ncbi:hypothetical protein [Deinococcus soli (ex Cha et al. 2016)]|uniref:Uncharacterized protein n=2 Tax=Deinococcus soli (ex Cha et al. 2016) TaxID=1309411 RepID=A0AAE3XCQ0_9DEIO|nr:hypothetical protein [Deinococcus soli (ex Cha et al. 2016)]MDR6218626.1 hypothetical protein [Deinococcus soli (ex Cha et al. 2016)]MDR6328423.1 hypothetical protein [Deinococcus soli (ex Cha et al. 2016)]MDR6753034.1 hypothetical protein [Deinococcus soli (ex Cha et al. 2016)]